MVNQDVYNQQRSAVAVPIGNSQVRVLSRGEIQQSPRKGSETFINQVMKAPRLTNYEQVLKKPKTYRETRVCSKELSQERVHSLEHKNNDIGQMTTAQIAYHSNSRNADSRERMKQVGYETKSFQMQQLIGSVAQSK